MSNEQRKILLKTDTKTIMLELGREGKFSAKATGWDKNKVIKPGEKIEISVVHGRWLIVKMPATTAEADSHADASSSTSLTSERCYRSM
jgi:hypothetical protein